MSILAFAVCAFIAGVFIKCGAYAIKVGFGILLELFKRI